MKAFPLSFQWDEQHAQNNGMDLRDYFAAHAMKYMGLPTKVIARIGDNIWDLDDQTFPYEIMAKVAYKWADAMMKARGQE